MVMEKGRKKGRPMLLIDKSGSRQACDCCHRVRVKFSRPTGTVCDECRKALNKNAHALHEQALAVQAALRTERAV